ncbi:hypothetical protein [Streptomyces himalayensis]|uniref:Uncharacterized protein n=1 Tax=Streptomyces himalayensis subsp. himalayensis TaxID=2756131 RepID=A0A7W0DVC6_9ACTN|nr:hypothetical protein [Streptomyces himalayensis]MBA2951986.1 hypothetical protein [Streptomyces himalayensis subsp. himalayensis]
MTVLVCSLKTDLPQSIPADGGYHIVRFPYAAESYDAYGMHQQLDPKGYEVRDWQRDDRSGLIWPALHGWGSLTAMIYWADGTYTELRDRFVRDPLGLSTGYDSTATEHRPPSPGLQCFHKSHEMFVHPGRPLALLVAHNDSRPRSITLAELKLAIHPTAEGL